MSENGAPLLEVTDLVKYFPIKKGIMIGRTVGAVQAVDGVSFEIPKGKTLGLVGESGCGKSTLSRTILQLIEPTSGSIKFDGQEIAGLNKRKMRPLRREMQMIFQDPYASLNPRKRVGSIIGDVLKIHGIGDTDERRKEVEGLLDRVGLSAEHYNRYPHEFSALDVSIQAQIINLLEDLQDEFDLTYLFVAHDLGVVRHVADEVAVMYLGKIVEMGPIEEVYTNPVHPYTEALLSAVPIPDPRANAERQERILEGDVPSPANPPSACRFHTRCPYATEICSEVTPELVNHRGSQVAACHHPLNVQASESNEREVSN